MIDQYKDKCKTDTITNIFVTFNRIGNMASFHITLLLAS